MTPLLYIAIQAGLSSLVGYFGRDRKFGFWGYFFLSLFLTPIVGLVCMFASDPKPEGEAGTAPATS